MAGKYEIQILVDTTKAVPEMQKAEKGMDKVAASTKKAGEELKKVETVARGTGNAAAALGKEMDKTGRETEKLTGKKRTLFEGLKKLGNEFPIVGAALGALRNPFTLVAVAGVLAKKALDDYIASIERMADTVRNTEVDRSSFLAFFHEVAQGKVEETAFEKRLDAIINKTETAGERLARLKTEIDATFDEQDRRAKESGRDTPEAAALRGLNRKIAIVQATGNVARQAQGASDIARGALPGARAAAAADKRAVGVVAERGRGMTEDLAKEEAALLIERQKLADQIGTDRGPLGTTLGKLGLLEGQGLFEFGTTGMRARAAARIEEIDFRLGGIAKSRSLSEADAITIGGRAAASTRTVAGLQSQAEEGAETARNLRVESSAAAMLTPAEAAANEGRRRASNAAQFRFEAQAKALGDAVESLTRRINSADPKSKAASQNNR